MMIKLTIEQLEKTVENMKNSNKYHNKRGFVYVVVKKHPNGREYIEFEQPSDYSECFEDYFRFSAEKEAVL